MNPSITLEGLREAQRALRAAGGTAADAKAMNRRVVDEVLVPESKRRVPVRSGNLKGSIDSDATAVYGFILAGGHGDVAYAGVIHFGWSTRGLGRGKLTGTVKERRERLQHALDRSGLNTRRALTSRATNKAARSSMTVTKTLKERESNGRFVKGGRTLGTVTTYAAKGGPIRPQPWIYDAIDGRAEEVEQAYEDQLSHRFEIEGLL